MPYKNPKDRNYKREYEMYQGTEDQKKKRAMRNAARRKLIRPVRCIKVMAKTWPMWSHSIKVVATAPDFV